LRIATICDSVKSFVQAELGYQALPPGILILQLLQLARLVWLQAAVELLPA
jgi:hypothetical protein